MNPERQRPGAAGKEAQPQHLVEIRPWDAASNPRQRSATGSCKDVQYWCGACRSHPPESVGQPTRVGGARRVCRMCDQSAVRQPPTPPLAAALLNVWRGAGRGSRAGAWRENNEDSAARRQEVCSSSRPPSPAWQQLWTALAVRGGRRPGVARPQSKGVLVTQASPPPAHQATRRLVDGPWSAGKRVTVAKQQRPPHPPPPWHLLPVSLL